ncbi:hypothetical protein T440DRAFT_189168 [Plenodomus tracheiphilus IPT5]|uniref:C3H1-type domain-containing protein n=1 Tax=Plenodomus tracheiphilus IPT5 TaxID=1408161 RepID=A0A6A7AZQ1_9PLEO|nr:hypothetical protein T440DRAFT_189168 [Plenodomus tracheiphilus IPT5]
MTSFKFPPPPPPPPKASSNDTQQTYGGDRGRGRGGGPSRGTGMHSSGGSSRGGYGPDNARGGRGRGGSRGGSQHPRGGANQRGGHSTGNSQPQYQQVLPSNAPPAQAYINPAFVNQPQAQGQAQPQVDPNALAQVMSFMSTPAGVQSMAAFASHMTSGSSASAQPLPSPPPRNTQTAPRYSPQQQAGQKRKLGDRSNNAQPLAQPPPAQQTTKPPRAKAAVPPPVPSFGFSLPAPSVVQSTPTSNTKGKKEQKKRKLNLGLSDAPLPADEPTSDAEAEEEDVDEEAAYAQKLKGGGFAFEHEGEQITIRTAAEVAAWIRDRRKNFPTQQRIVEKAQEKASKRASELEFLRKLKGLPPKTQDNTRLPRPAHAAQPQRPKDTAKPPGTNPKAQEDLAALRQKLHQSMLDKQHKPSPAVNLALGYDSDSSLASDAESSVVSSIVSSDEASSSEDSESENEDEDRNEAPISTSSKVAPPPIKVPPPAPKENVEKLQQQRGKKVCETWQRTGRCKFSNKCKFAHPPKDKEKVGGVGMSLYERMVEQELVKGDEAALEAIKFLGRSGMLG